VWGGEILIVEENDFERAAHLAYVPMPGSTAAIKEPWRMAISYLQHAYGEEFRNLDLPVLHGRDSETFTVISEMISKGVNSPLTSSLGRLFDGVAAICGIRSQVNFEGQAAMELEMLAADTAESTYDYEWLSDDTYKILPAPIILGVVKDLQDGKSVADVSAKFHWTLICLFADLCTVIRKERDLNRVVLSGGVFQNSILLSGLINALEERNFVVFSHQQVPTNDGGIALGQAVVAAAVSRR
jgi:hydrogenase maturation protein HypF